LCQRGFGKQGKKLKVLEEEKLHHLYGETKCHLCDDEYTSDNMEDEDHFSDESCNKREYTKDYEDKKPAAK
jgi:hypothetical protein